MIEPNTLLKLLEEYEIEIPRIQRDYVQGRMDDRSSIVRKNLINSIKLAIENKTAPLDLNFIYGKTTTEKKFYPVDGQQRLTTLFLLHILAFSDDESKTELLLKFSYQARTTTRKFFEALVMNRNSIFRESTSPEKVIVDSAWFVDSWKYDPSVINAICTLNDLYTAGYNVNDLKIKLEEKQSPRIYFQFVQLDELGREDDLYIKLNARGRSLTAFENFKSKFVDECASKCEELSDEMNRALDGEWADFIWKISKERFDEYFLRFFETIFLNYSVLKIEPNASVSRNWIYSLNYFDLDIGIFTSIRNTLNYLSLNSEKTAATIVIDTLKGTPSYSKRLLFHMICKYLSDEFNPEAVDNGKFSDWIRVFTNLINNSRIEEVDVYLRAIESIDNLAKYKNSIEDYLASSEIGEIRGFLKEQIDEEREKARIITKGASFKSAILEAEKKLTYFSGQIRSVLFYSHLEEKENIELFDEFVRKIDCLFEADKPVEGELLRRAMLSIGDYRLHVGSYRTLCIDDPNENSRTSSLKRLFSEHGKIVEKLLSYIDTSKPVDEQLKRIIENYNITQRDWRYCLINFPKLFKLMKNSHLRMYNNNKEELLIPNKQSNGKNFSLYLETISLLVSGGTYKFDYGAYGDRFLEINDNKIRFENGNYIVEGRDGKKWRSSTENVIDETVEYLKTLLHDGTGAGTGKIV